MRGLDQAVRNFEYTIRVGDVSAASAALLRVRSKLSDEDVTLVAELKDRLRGLEAIERQYGSGAALDLAAPTVKSLIRTGHIAPDKVEAAKNYLGHLIT